MGFSRWVFLLVLVMVSAFVIAGTARGQVNTVDLSGRVPDPQGAGVPAAEVAVKNLATGATPSTTSDATGRYLLMGLAPGGYELTVETEGFARFVNAELVPTIGQLAEFNVNLGIKAATTARCSTKPGSSLPAGVCTMATRNFRAVTERGSTLRVLPFSTANRSPRWTASSGGSSGPTTRAGSRGTTT
jgi:hypothetical protein